MFDSFQTKCSAKIALAVVLFGSLGIYLPFKSAAQNEIPNNVSTQGRALTLAGKLLTDAATNLPAVAPLTVDFVRSPDNSGADGKGRYLIAVNSGFGLQFNGESKAQQTLSVIEMKTKKATMRMSKVKSITENENKLSIGVL